MESEGRDRWQETNNSQLSMIQFFESFNDNDINIETTLNNSGQQDFKETEFETREGPVNSGASTPHTQETNTNGFHQNLVIDGSAFDTSEIQENHVILGNSGKPGSVETKLDAIEEDVFSGTASCHAQETTTNGDHQNQITDSSTFAGTKNSDGTNSNTIESTIHPIAEKIEKMGNPKMAPVCDDNERQQGYSKVGDSIVEQNGATQTATTDEQSTNNYDVDMNNVSNEVGTSEIDPVEIIEIPASSKFHAKDTDVIDLIDDDENDDSEDVEANNTALLVQAAPRSVKRQRILTNHDYSHGNSEAAVAAMASYHGRQNNTPHWMNQVHLNNQRGKYSDIPNHSVSSSSVLKYPPYSISTNRPTSHVQFDVPNYIGYPSNFKPSWASLIPQLELLHAQARPVPAVINSTQRKRVYQLSLLNVNEFTISGLPASWNTPHTSLTGLRSAIKKISKEHGSASFQIDKEDPAGGKWRIPLGAYHAFLSYLKADPFTIVEGIDPKQLQIASLEKARQDRGYPEAKELVEKNVPEGLANALAPFQRGGVDFALAKHGRALIADEMGLGKSIQGIASMAAFHEEWPLLVLCPSGARYHWEHEFRHWLGVKSAVNAGVTKKDGLLRDSQIHVIANSKNDILPNKNIRVAICSYGLAPTLIISGKLRPLQFRCAIVDESHMLKNKLSKRTATLLPILQATTRCILLSGTPAMARPAELWPQLSILLTEQEGWWASEREFMDKYVKDGSPKRSAELHTMLRGTVMIRRLKADVMKSMPKKIRELAEIYVIHKSQRQEFRFLLHQLRQGNGQLAKLSRLHQQTTNDEFNNEDDIEHGNGSQTSDFDFRDAIESLKSEYRQKAQEGKHRILQSLANVHPETIDSLKQDMESILRDELEQEYQQRANELEIAFRSNSSDALSQTSEVEENKGTILSRLYGLTGDAKVPLIIDMLQKWLADPTKGKLCIFAHHISVLDAIEKQTGLKVGKNCIRIDGTTLPKARQQHIADFQTKPEIRIALLGITAAGVAVTLTASSTVWFAELFWTPSIMIQAEDRCHRIGQQARVKCLYFVAKGTIDDILWKLIELKFKDLGEFVEGKEKLKIVVDEVHKGKHELYRMFSSLDDNEDDEDVDKHEAEQVEDDLQLDSDIVRTIEKLGKEEERMLRENDEDNDGNDGEVGVEDSKPAALKIPAGATEDAAIPLSDDEDEVNDEVVDSDNVASMVTTNQTELPVQVPSGSFSSDSMYSSPLDDCRVYKISIGDTKLGIEVCLFKKRVIVAKISQLRLQRLGVISKPEVGDILVGVNKNRLALVPNLNPVMAYLQKVLRNPPADLTFVEIPLFKVHFKALQQRKKAATTNQEQIGNATVVLSHLKSTTPSSDSTIELVDDD